MRTDRVTPLIHKAFKALLAIFAFYSVFETRFALADKKTGHKMDAPAELIARGEEFYKKGDFEHAALSWEQAIHLMNPEPDTAMYSETVMHLANAYQELGYHMKALAVLDNALPYVEKSNDKYSCILILNTLGDVHLSLGNIVESFNYLMKGVKKAQSLADSDTGKGYFLASSLNNLGNILVADENFQEALTAYDECIKLISQSENAADLKSKVLMNLFFARSEISTYEDALAALNDSLAHIRSRQDSHEKAANMISLALLIRKRVQKSKTGNQKSELHSSQLTTHRYNLLNEAKQIGSVLQNPVISSYAYGYMGQLYEDRKRYPEALKLTRSAIFLAEQGNYPEILYLWQWQTGRLFKALGRVEQAEKAYTGAIQTLSPIRHELFRGHRLQKDSFKEKVKPVYLGFAELQLMQAETADEENRVNRLKQARDTIELLKTAELQDFFQDECITTREGSESPNHAPPNTALIYPISFQDHLTLLMILPNGMKHVNVPVDSDRLGTMVKQFRKHLQTRTRKLFIPDGRQLFDWLIRPAEPELTAQDVDTLIIAPDGALRLIPFSALLDGRRFLVEKYAVGTIPASIGDPWPVEMENIPTLLIGISESVQDFPPLPNVKQELEDIKEIMDARTVLRDQEYTISNITEELKNKEYSVVHIATHGVFGGNYRDSFLLAYDDKLTMNRLEQLISLGRFRENQVELLTLSACQTALGDERAALGLAGVAVKAGAGSAVATLWFVDDEATSVAVREFYRQLRIPGMTKAKALQNTQKKLIAKLRYRHPIYWAPFLLIGNWL